MNGKTERRLKSSSLIAGGIFLIFILFIIGCATTMPQKQKTGAMLWGENCNRCHNVRTPSEFEDAQWDVVVSHMRTRANLTANEAEKIVGFLKVAN